MNKKLREKIAKKREEKIRWAKFYEILQIVKK